MLTPQRTDMNVSAQSVVSGETVLDLDAVFETVTELARLLHGAGHREQAALLNGIGDMCELWRQRQERGRPAAAPDATLDYVLDQMDDLAEMMEDAGQLPAAALFRVPGQLSAAAGAARASTAARIKFRA